MIASLPPIDTGEVASSCYVGLDAPLISKLLDSVLEGCSLFNVDPFCFPLCHRGLA